MMISRRPELEKDNPTAPQIYVGPRRRRALAGQPAVGPAAARTATEAAVRKLILAAEDFLDEASEARRIKLAEAIEPAQRLLAKRRRTAAP